MTSRITREDVKAAAWLAGVKDPKQLNRLLRVVDGYAYSLARTAEPEPLIIPEAGESARTGAALYLCRECDKRFPIEAFPPARKDNPQHPYDCIKCGGADRKTYLCPECRKDKPLGEFPLVKQENPRIRSLCSWCLPRSVTVKDAETWRKK